MEGKVPRGHRGGGGPWVDSLQALLHLTPEKEGKSLQSIIPRHGLVFLAQVAFSVKVGHS